MEPKKYEIRGYTIIQPLYEAERFRLHEIALPDKKGVGVLKIAVDAAYNSILESEASILQKMRDEAARLEDEYAPMREYPEQRLNYQISFPNLVESFVAEEQGDRMVNILTFDGITDDLGRLAPIAQITLLDNARVDAMTSAWMMGKMLKLIAFAHNQNIAINNVNGDNFLLERDQHYVAIFDLTKATLHEDGVPTDIASADITQAAREVTIALEGDLDTGALPDDGQLKDSQYADYLRSLVCGKEGDANKAHADFYTIVKSLWPRKFYPFTTRPRGEKGAKSNGKRSTVRGIL